MFFVIHFWTAYNPHFFVYFLRSQHLLQSLFFLHFLILIFIALCTNKLLHKSPNSFNPIYLEGHFCTNVITKDLSNCFHDLRNGGTVFSLRTVTDWLIHKPLNFHSFIWVVIHTPSRGASGLLSQLSWRAFRRKVREKLSARARKKAKLIFSTLENRRREKMCVKRLKIKKRGKTNVIVSKRYFVLFFQVGSYSQGVVLSAAENGI